MAQAIYVYKKPRIFSQKSHKKRDRFFFALISFVGLSAIIFAAWPLLIWQITTLPRLTAGVTKLPIPKSQVLSAKSTLESNVQVIKDPDGFSYFVPTTFPKEEGRNKPSYFAPKEEGRNKPSYFAPKEEGRNKPSYFVPTSLQKGAKDRPTEFYLSIPKLKIFKAKVKVDNLNFKSALSHFPNSALPGEMGNSFITGHSILPQFYDPENYLAIFSKLSDLEIGDDVIAELGENKFHYTVAYSKIVDPHDLSVLSKISQNGRNLTLMTCVPPGTNTKRLVVVTSLL